MNEVVKVEYFTIPELLEKYPGLKRKLNWGASELGLFLRCRLVRGYYDRKKRIAMIDSDSLCELIRFTNLSIEKQKITF